jgi:hypothetical protein
MGHHTVLSSNPEIITNQVVISLRKLRIIGKVNSMKKLFVVVRKDLTPSQRAVQAGHALAEYLLHGPNFRWKNEILIYLGVKDLKQLENVRRKLEFEGIRYSQFKEPDMNNELTALASDEDCRIFERLTLL